MCRCVHVRCVHVKVCTYMCRCVQIHTHKQFQQEKLKINRGRYNNTTRMCFNNVPPKEAFYTSIYFIRQKTSAKQLKRHAFDPPERDMRLRVSEISFPENYPFQLAIVIL